MYPAEISPTASVPRDALPTGVSRARLREICYRSVSQTPDAELDENALTVISDTERLTGLKLFPGSFEARFPIFHRPPDEGGRGWYGYADGSNPQQLFFRTPLLIPGVNTSAIAVALPSGDTVEPRLRIADEVGNVTLLPPSDGWGFGHTPDLQAAITVTFTAGGQIPRPLVRAIGLGMQFLFNQEPEDEKAWRNRASYYAYRYEL